MRALGRRLLQGLLLLTLLLPQVAQARQVRLELSVPEHRQGLSAAVDVWGFEGGERVWLRDDGQLEGDIHVHWTLKGTGEGTLSEPQVERVNVRGPERPQRPLQVAVAGGFALVAVGGLALRARRRS